MRPWFFRPGPCGILLGLILTGPGCKNSFEPPIRGEDENLNSPFPAVQELTALQGPPADIAEPRPDPFPVSATFQDLNNLLCRQHSELDRIGECLRRLGQEHDRLEARARLGAVALAGVLRIPIRPDLQRDVVEFVLIPPDTFLMGRTNEERVQANLRTNALQHDSSYPQHEVRLTRGYFLARYEVTRRLYGLFLRAPDRPNGLSAEPGPREKWTPDPEEPVSGISWGEAVAFCDWLGRRPEVRRLGARVRLPTEVEWEFAARGPAGLRFPWPSPGEFRNDRHSPNRPSPVGRYPQDRSWRGINDMASNVSEWCQDFYDERAYVPYQNQPLVYEPRPDPPTPTGTSALRPALRHCVYRGGSFIDEPTNCEAATRRWKLKDTREAYLGFRPALILPAEAGEERPATAPDLVPRADRATRPARDDVNPALEAPSLPGVPATSPGAPRRYSTGP